MCLISLLGLRDAVNSARADKQAPTGARGAEAKVVYTLVRENLKAGWPNHRLNLLNWKDNPGGEPMELAGRV